ncbi:MAG TPA: YkvA family protein [Nodularia sp. (in: cyanobacteria)]|nr:YkvA family protein [Nodularia sp. (in: cyanobacteria)]
MNFSMQSMYNWYRNLLRNPKYRWWVILGTLVYILSPIDVVPDFIPIFGQVDDVLVLSVLFTELSGLAIAALKARKGSDQPSDETVDVDAVSVK